MGTILSSVDPVSYASVVDFIEDINFILAKLPLQFS